MTKKIVTFCTILAMTLGGGAALAEHKAGHPEGRTQAPATAAESLHADVKKHQSCPHCGMDREKFAVSRMMITYSDGTSIGVCSIHCAVTEMKANKGKAAKAVEVADFGTKRLIDAEKASWVIGGNKKGVMTRVAKWAFEKKDDAAAFIKHNGGKLATYKEALATAEKE